MKRILRVLCCVCCCCGLLALAADAQNPVDQAKKNQEFYKNRSALSKRTCGVLLKAMIAFDRAPGGDEIHIAWSMDYSGPRQPLIILEPSLEEKTFGQTTVRFYAEGKDRRIYEYDLESPSPMLFGTYPGRYLTVAKGKTATGKLRISTGQVGGQFRTRWPEQFDAPPPVVHVQLLHSPKVRGGNLDVWIGELFSTVQQVPLRMR